MHVRKKHKDPSFVCDICAKAFHQRAGFEKHKLEHEDPEKLKMQCQHCFKWYKSHAVLYVHIRNTHREPQYVCDICAKKFRLRSEFKKHKLSHEDPDKLKMQCPHCMKWYKTREYWRAHIRLSHNTKPLEKCELCDRTYPNIDALRSHKKNVHGERTKKCDWCDASFTKAISLREHIASRHTGDPLYTCPFCPKTFNSNANMHSHKRKMHPVEWLAGRKRTTVAKTTPSEEVSKC